ncbi:hypothetical protein ACFX15_027963 [Malus domestica]
MPPQSLPPKFQNFTFFHCHRKPAQNRPTVRVSHPNPKHPTTAPQSQPFDLSKWDPHLPHSLPSTSSPNPDDTTLLSFLSPIARFILDAFRKNRNHWGSPVVSELRKLRRVTPDLVAEVLKVQDDPVSASKFFPWAG